MIKKALNLALQSFTVSCVNCHVFSNQILQYMRKKIHRNQWFLYTLETLIMAGDLNGVILKFVKQSKEIEFNLTKIVSRNESCAAIGVKFDGVPTLVMDYGPSNVLATATSKLTDNNPRINSAALAIESGVWINDIRQLETEEIGKLLSFSIKSAVQKSRVIRLFVELSRINFDAYYPNYFSAKATEILAQNKEKYLLQEQHKQSSSLNKEAQVSTVQHSKELESTQSTSQPPKTSFFVPKNNELRNDANATEGNVAQEQRSKTIVTSGLAAAAGAALTGLAAFGIYKLTKSSGSTGSSLRQGQRNSR